MGEWQLDFKREPIETTRNGVLGGPADPYRTFVPGPLTGVATDPDGNRYTLTAAEFAAVSECVSHADALVRVADLIRRRAVSESE